MEFAVVNFIPFGFEDLINLDERDRHVYKYKTVRLKHERKLQPPEANADIQLKLQTRLWLKKDLTLITILSAHFD